MHCFCVTAGKQFLVQTCLQIRVQGLVFLAQGINDSFQCRMLRNTACSVAAVSGIPVLNGTITQYTLALNPGQGGSAQFAFRGMAGEMLDQITILGGFSYLHPELQGRAGII